MKYLYVAILIFFVCCKQMATAKCTFTLTDKSGTFLWRDADNNVFVNEKLCKSLTDPERATLGFVVTLFEDEWVGDRKAKKLKDIALNALGLGYFRPDQHLSFIKKWFEPYAVWLESIIGEDEYIYSGYYYRRKSYNYKVDNSYFFNKTDTIQYSYS